MFRRMELPPDSLRCCVANLAAVISMSIQDLSWDPIHTSAYSHTRSLLRPAQSKKRAGGLRYRCPITGSFILVTDDSTLEWLARPNARLRCAGCGELHAIGQEADYPADGTAMAAPASSAA